MGIPTNIVDAASAIKNGDLGLLTEVKIGELVVSALVGISGSDVTDIVQRPVEAGFSNTDSAIDKPRERLLEVVLTNPDFSVESGVQAALTGSVSQFTETWRDKKEKLYAIKKQKLIIDVVTHDEIFPSMMIAEITPHYDVEENWEAFVATVRLQEYQVEQTDESLLDEALGGLSEIGGF